MFIKRLVIKELMVILTLQNIRKYLQSRGLLHSEDSGESIDITKVVDGGFINSVFVVSRQRDSFVIKQLLEQAQRAKIKPRRERFHYEVAALQLIKRYAPNLPVPRVLFADEDNFIFAMSKAPENQSSYQKALMEGAFRWGNMAQEVPRQLGAFQASIHSATWKKQQVAKAIRDNPGYADLRFFPSLEYPAKRNPLLYPLLQEVFKKNARNAYCLIHADTTPKNVLLNDNKITVFDFEVATFGDPAQDVGITLAHFLLPIWKNPRWIDDYLKCTQLFLQEYFSQIHFSLPTGSFVQNIKDNCAAMMLGRVDGIIEFEYLKKDKASVRYVVRNLLTANATTTHELLGLISRIMEKELNREPSEVSS